MPVYACRYCKKPIRPDAKGYLHADTGSSRCIEPHSPGLDRAEPYGKLTYPEFRAENIKDITSNHISYSYAHSPSELLEMLLADARHFADFNTLNFDEHDHRSYELYLQNNAGTQD